MIIVIGGSGFVGTYLVDELVRQGRDVLVCGRNPAAKAYYGTRNIPWLDFDLRDRSHISRLPKQGVDAVVLLSALVPANVSVYEPQAYLDINITGTLDLLEYCRRNGVPTLVNASSHSDVAGLWDCGRPITEADPRSYLLTGDHAVYIVSKMAAIDLIEHYRQEYGIRGVSLRLPAVYGFGPHTEIYVDTKRHVTGFKRFLMCAQAGETVEVWGDWSKGRDLVYVKDVVGAFIGAVDHKEAAGLYNVASGVRTTLEEEARGIAAVFSPVDRPARVVNVPEKPNSVHTYLYDISRAKRDLGYVVRFPYREFLADYKEEMERHRFPHLQERERKC